jgi:hypothetical protein
VILVPVGEHQRLDVIQPVLDRPEVGQDQIDPGRVVLRKQHPAVHYQQPAGMLEDSHVAADFADAAQGDHPQATFG